MEKLERIKRRIEVEKRVADPEKAEHDKLMQEREAKVQRGKRLRTAEPPTAANPVAGAAVTTPRAS